MSGKEIKSLIKSNGVKLREVAERLNMCDSDFSRRLRKPFDSDEVDRIKAIIIELKDRADEE